MGIEGETEGGRDGWLEREGGMVGWRGRERYYYHILT